MGELLTPPADYALGCVHGLVVIQRTDRPFACPANHYLDGASSRQQVLLEPD